jgi:hypothetical protein
MFQDFFFIFPIDEMVGQVEQQIRFFIRVVIGRFDQLTDTVVYGFLLSFDFLVKSISDSIMCKGEIPSGKPCILFKDPIRMSFVKAGYN